MAQLTPATLLIIDKTDPRLPEVANLLQSHLDFCKSVTPPKNVYALNLDGLVSPNITVYSAVLDGKTVGVGALKELDAEHAELKSMHTAEVDRGIGIGTAMVAHLLNVARDKGIKRVSLETGNFAEFAPARNLYKSFGFEDCPVFGDYQPSPISVCMTKYI